jgi:hypothetical protein
MGIKFIDADDDLLGHIARLVEALPDRTDPGMGRATMPSRERTMLGIGESAESPEVPSIAPTPIVSIGSTREKTMLGVGQELPVPLETEKSIAIDLVARREAASEEPVSSEPPIPSNGFEGTPAPVPERRGDPEAAPPPEAPDDAPISRGSLAAAGLPRRRRGVWLVLLLILVLAGGAVYPYRARLPAQWQRLRYYAQTHLSRS